MKKTIAATLMIIFSSFFLFGCNQVEGIVKPLELTTREILLTQLRTPALFELNNGEYQLIIEHYSFGELMGHEIYFDNIDVRNDQGYLIIKKEVFEEYVKFSLGASTPSSTFATSPIFVIEDFTAMAWSSGVLESEFHLGIGEKSTIFSAQFSDDQERPMTTVWPEFRDEVHSTKDIQHLVWISLKRIN